VTCHVFAETTHAVAAPPNLAWMVIRPTWLYILGFIEIRSGVSEPQRVEYLASPLLYLVAFTTAWTTVQAVIIIITLPATLCNAFCLLFLVILLHLPVI